MSLSFFSSFFGSEGDDDVEEAVEPGVGVADLFSPFDSDCSALPLILSNRFFNNSSHSRGHLLFCCCCCCLYYYRTHFSFFIFHFFFFSQTNLTYL